VGLSASFATSAQEAGDVEASDYSDYFNDSRGKVPEGEGPRSLGEARAQGKAYRIGQTGSVYRRPSQEIHTVHDGDTLWDISDRYFGDPWHWPELWSYNPEITNPHWIYPQDRVRLSSTTQANEESNATQLAAVHKGTGGAFREPSQGLATDLAPRVTVPRKLLEGGAIFLRDEGYLDDDQIKQGGEVLAAGEENMLLSDSDVVYVRFHKGQKVTVGQAYTVYHPVRNEDRETDAIGHLVRIQGTVLVSSYDQTKGVARGVITETIDPIERGMPVTFMERRFILEPARPNRVNVVARIIGSSQPRTLLAYGDLVFLNVGKDKGVVPGNRFFVVRRGDNWQEMLTRSADQMGNIVPVPEYNKDNLPKEVVAEMRVVHVRKKITIAVITRSNTDLAHGDQVEMRVGY
jgi:hypothetical protein